MPNTGRAILQKNKNMKVSKFEKVFQKGLRQPYSLFEHLTIRRVINFWNQFRILANNKLQRLDQNDFLEVKVAHRTKAEFK